MQYLISLPLWLCALKASGPLLKNRGKRELYYFLTFFLAAMTAAFYPRSLRAPLDRLSHITGLHKLTFYVACLLALLFQYLFVSEMLPGAKRQQARIVCFVVVVFATFAVCQVKVMSDPALAANLYLASGTRNIFVFFYQYAFAFGLGVMGVALSKGYARFYRSQVQTANSVSMYAACTACLLVASFGVVKGLSLLTDRLRIGVQSYQGILDLLVVLAAIACFVSIVLAKHATEWWHKLIESAGRLLHYSKMFVVRRNLLALYSWINDRLVALLPYACPAAVEYTRQICEELRLPAREREVTIEASKIYSIYRRHPVIEKWNASFPEAPLYDLEEETVDSGDECAASGGQVKEDALSKYGAGKAIEDVYFYSDVYLQIRDVGRNYNESLRKSRSRWLRANNHDWTRCSIPIGSRILAVIDFFLYKAKPLAEAEAVAMLQEEAGKRFDPEVVEAFLKVLEEDRERKVIA